jgi:frataxin
MHAYRLTTALARASGRLTHSSAVPRITSAALVHAGITTRAGAPVVTPRARPFSTTQAAPKGIMPDRSASDVIPVAPEEPQSKSYLDQQYSVPELSDHQYHSLSDSWIDGALTKLEELQDQREDVDVEYSAGVLTLSFGTVGKYVVNKQPPNKQIWLSSPVSGPSRYDYVQFGDSQQEKEGTSRGTWMNLRDGRLLDDVLEEELGVSFKLAIFS